jgi:hypothetical protein
MYPEFKCPVFESPLYYKNVSRSQGNGYVLVGIKYSDHPTTGFVKFPNGRIVQFSQMVQFVMAPLAWTILNTEKVIKVFSFMLMVNTSRI